MSNTQPSVELAPSRGSNRMVWILNSHTEAYTEKFRGGVEITVPANDEKIMKHITKGGNLCEFLAARRFIGQPKAQAQVAVNGRYLSPPKALRTMELTETEINKLEGAAAQEKVKADKMRDKEQRNVCTLCQDGKTFATEKALRMHLMTDHADDEPNDALNYE